jgi:hypothetical protein
MTMSQGPSLFSNYPTLLGIGSKIIQTRKWSWLLPEAAVFFRRLQPSPGKAASDSEHTRR